jgi:hypothetical protein
MSIDEKKRFFDEQLKQMSIAKKSKAIYDALPDKDTPVGRLYLNRWQRAQEYVDNHR